MRRIVMIAALAALALVAACTTAPDGSKKPDQAKIEAALGQVEITFAGLTTAAALFCAVQPDHFPCNSPDALNKLAAAKAVASNIVAKARADIAAAQTQTTLQVALTVATDALLVYADALKQFGIKPAG